MTESFDMDALLDSKLDDLEDLPEFKPFSPGGHRLSVTLSAEVINSKPAIKADLTLIETLELADPNTESPSKPGDTCNIAFFLDNEFGQGKFKNFIAPFKEHFGFTTNREAVDGTKEIECIAITNVRPDKKDKTKLYLDVVSIHIE